MYTPHIDHYREQTLLIHASLLRKYLSAVRTRLHVEMRDGICGCIQAHWTEPRACYDETTWTNQQAIIMWLTFVAEQSTWH
jgi:hypothetical protein